MADHRAGSSLGEEWNDELLHHPLHLKRDAGHDDEELSVSIKEVSRRGPSCVLNDGATARDESLILVHLDKGNAALLGKSPDMFQRLLIHDQVRLEECADGAACHVIVGRPQPSRYRYDIEVRKGLHKGTKDLFLLVSDRDHAFDRNADGVEFLGDVRLIGVDHLANKKLVADGEDCGSHGPARGGAIE